MNNSLTQSTAPHGESPARKPWIDRLFDEMVENYGSQWQERWGGASLVDVKLRWRSRLEGFAEEPHRIRYALDHLPRFVPSLPEFVELCRMAPPLSGPAALPHRLTPEERDHQRELARAASAAAKKCGYDNLAWARRPASQAAAAMLHEAWKQPFRYPELAKIFDDLLAQGVVDRAGKLLKAAA